MANRPQDLAHGLRPAKPAVWSAVVLDLKDPAEFILQGQGSHPSLLGSKQEAEA